MNFVGSISDGKFLRKPYGVLAEEIFSLVWEEEREFNARIKTKHLEL